MDRLPEALRALVAGCGNRRRGDDALGPLVIERLLQRGHRTAQVVDLETRPDRLLDCLIGDVEFLVLVDAVECRGRRAGLLVETDWPALAAQRERPVATHGLSLISALKLAEQLGRLPAQVSFLGVTVENMAHESSVSAAVAARVDEVAARVETLIAAAAARRSGVLQAAARE